MSELEAVKAELILAFRDSDASTATLAQAAMANFTNMQRLAPVVALHPIWGLAVCQLTAVIARLQQEEAKAKPEAPPAPSPAGQMIYPEDMSPALRDVLGRLCFHCIHLAQALRLRGQVIERRAEDEQAAVLHWLVKIVLRHGDQWITAASEELRKMGKDNGETSSS